MLRILSFVMAMGVLSLGCALVSAQTGPVGPSVQPPAPGTLPPLPEDAIVAALKALDSNVQVQKLTNGNQYKLKVVRDGWSYDLRVMVFAGRVWLESDLGSPMSDPSKLPANLLLQLLEENERIGPTHFAFYKTSSGLMQLNICHMLDRAITIERFTKGIDEFLKDIRQAHPVWSAVLAQK